eukprot:8280265-Alexandrium_andersonii.AAC.1
MSTARGHAHARAHGRAHVRAHGHGHGHGQSKAWKRGLFWLGLGGGTGICSGSGQVTFASVDSKLA